MKVSYEWLSEYVDVSGYTATELAEKLTRSGIEVDVVENRNQGVSKVFVGYVKTKEKHPNADKLSVCTVDVGEAEDLQIVCGAKNVDAGQKVPVAVVGAVLPNNFKIKRAKLRGVESQGMICSAKEIGLNDKLLSKEAQDGILILPDDLELGTDVLEALAMNDEVMELDLTPNRSDCLSMLGVAYEMAAILDREIKLPLEQIQSGQKKAADHISVKISAPEQCQHYAARLIEGIQIADSPQWLQNRLMAAGIRPINNIVDITNYVMLEYGQPLHAFDADCLNDGHIDVRMANDGEKIVTLDNVERTLNSDMLLITDGTDPVALAGVMGGANSEVTESTSRILLESARFAGTSVRKTSRQLGLRSEASLRFEKEINPQAVIPALNRAAELIAQYANGQIAEGVVDDLVKGSELVEIPLSLSRVNQYLGTEITVEEMASIFSRLGFAYEQQEEVLHVVVPARRGDITRDVDLIEEVARIYGYDNIPTSLMSGVTTPGSLNEEQIVRRRLRQLLTDSGLNEVINYSLTQTNKIATFPGLFKESKTISLAMPMSEERKILRTSLIPHLLDNAIYNRNRNNDDIAIFEIGRIFATKEEKLTSLPEEKKLLSVLLTGHKVSSHWSEKGRAVDFFDVKGIAEKIFAYLGLNEIQYNAVQIEGMHPGRTASIQLNTEQGSISLGVIGQIHPALQQELDLDDTYIMEIELAPLYEHAEFNISYNTLPRYPSISRDIAVVVDESIAAAELVRLARNTAGQWLESIQVFDLYVGERLGAGKKSIALSLIYRHAERTLTDEEVSELHAKVVQALGESFEAELRK